MLVYGASGSMGTAGVQLAKHFGAEVTAVCDTKHVELVRSLGADEVIDYTKEDFRKNGVEYDVIFDAVGKHRFTRCKDSLKPGGAYLPTDGYTNFAMALWTRWFGDKKVRLSSTPVQEGVRPPGQAADRGGRVPPGHRPDVPAGRRGRGDAVRGDRAKDRQRRADRRLTDSPGRGIVRRGVAGSACYGDSELSSEYGGRAPSLHVRNT